MLWTAAMKVKELIVLLGKFPQNAEVWLKEATYGEPNTEYTDHWPKMEGGKLILGYDGFGGGDVD